MECVMPGNHTKQVLSLKHTQAHCSLARGFEVGLTNTITRQLRAPINHTSVKILTNISRNFSDDMIKLYTF
jgi:hypothetical protein